MGAGGGGVASTIEAVGEDRIAAGDLDVIDIGAIERAAAGSDRTCLQRAARPGK
jgi:hypothetical protein